MNALVEDIMKAGNADAESAVEEYYPACVKPTTGISDKRLHSSIFSTEYFDLKGQRLNVLQKGVMIRVDWLANGKRVVSKVIK